MSKERIKKFNTLNANALADVERYILRIDRPFIKQEISANSIKYTYKGKDHEIEVFRTGNSVDNYTYQLKIDGSDKIQPEQYVIANWFSEIEDIQKKRGF